jgi:hypothetical protein
MHTSLIELDEWLRSEIKYKDRAELQEFRDKFWEILRDNNIEDPVSW